MSICTCSFNSERMYSNILTLGVILLQVLLYPKFIYSLGFPKSSDKYHTSKLIGLFATFSLLIFAVSLGYYAFKYVQKGFEEHLKLEKVYCNNKKIPDPSTDEECNYNETVQKQFDYLSFFNNAIAVSISLFILFYFVFKDKSDDKVYKILYSILLFVLALFASSKKSSLIFK